jgi:hypothetical protein
VGATAFEDIDIKNFSGADLPTQRINLLVKCLCRSKNPRRSFICSQKLLNVHYFPPTRDAMLCCSMSCPDLLEYNMQYPYNIRPLLSSVIFPFLIL